MQIIAHRGASGLAPENTLKAIRLALALGAGAIEIDVQLADGELWVFHDRRLERCTDGSGVLTAQSRAYLASLDAGEGEGIPTLWQVMEAIAGQAELHIELKGAKTADEVARLTRRAEAELGFGPTQWVVSSFHHPELARFAALRPDIRLGALTSTIPLTLAKFAAELGAWSLNCDVDFVDQALVQDAHDRGLKVLVYTVDDPADQAMLAAIGVDGIFTNRPDRFLPPAKNGLIVPGGVR
ncbi:glycerophosphodiester phosphodiesterase [Aeromonas hydrophila]|uniref:glycerophosphodiester phosphodiesterase n=1 Tax=Aeromonas hydrophila TaxID=644 RepID=UPI0019313885|nr:glycerophosphodiester phosphodiesterase family protein [Aeromonas hydrophila]EHA1066851.1 glycerophosphodiester phosphodiesterase [Aeromonas hydrophila]MBM0436978.1 glycerophosphodiester phosphodiesterase [Aeromonas hydrophila subsp. ranae]MBW3827981.1 glycerophosphodiester phosphodiesterase [Aeromonas hydrophila]MCX4113859.1 glycerophosphodiester phosphodiesterase family protein [Aeromonas hydrophila]MDD9231794.1 glycerophosphodiester phosphodiesterase family protein [Aeromonas hydrophila]